SAGMRPRSIPSVKLSPRRNSRKARSRRLPSSPGTRSLIRASGTSRIIRSASPSLSSSRRPSATGSCPLTIRRSRGGLAPAERDRLLAREREHPIPEVLGVTARRDGLGLQLHLRLQALLRGLVEQELGPTEGQRGAGGQLAGERGDRARELGVRVNAIDEPPVHRLAGREDAS